MKIFIFLKVAVDLHPVRFEDAFLPLCGMIAFVFRCVLRHCNSASSEILHVLGYSSTVLPSFANKLSLSGSTAVSCS